MKKLIFAVALVASLGALEAKPIVEIYRKSGFCGMYNRVEQEYMGVINGRDWWILTCQNPGFNQCRMHYANTNFPSQVKDYELNDLNDALDWVGRQIDVSNNGSGNAIKHYLNQLSDGTSVDVYVQVKWEIDPQDSSQTHITCEVL